MRSVGENEVHIRACIDIVGQHNTFDDWGSRAIQAGLMPRTPRFQDDTELSDGSRYEMIAWEVPTRTEYPEGIKYGFQYMTADGTTLLRYDNYTDAETPGKSRHHRHHYHEGVKDIEFTGLRDHIRRFKQEVDQIHDERT